MPAIEVFVVLSLLVFIGFYIYAKFNNSYWLVRFMKRLNPKNAEMIEREYRELLNKKNKPKIK